MARWNRQQFGCGSRSEATARDRVERRRHQKEVRSYALARLHDFIFSAGQE
jgi:hypothetical protein